MPRVELRGTGLSCWMGRAGRAVRAVVWVKARVKGVSGLMLGEYILKTVFGEWNYETSCPPMRRLV